MGYVLIIGANSDMARALARKYAEKGYHLYLTARKESDVAALASDIRIRHQVDVQCFSQDILQTDSHRTFYQSLSDKPIGLISVVGYMGDQENSQKDFDEARLVINTNFTALVSLIEIMAEDLESRKEGFIIGVSSVAGDRGRKSNYVYGSAKAGFTAYLSGLRNRLSSSNVQVLTVKPGFVYTKMTEGLDLPKLLTAQPEEVASDIYKAQRKGRNVVYTKWFWKWIMLIIRMIPERMFKKMSI